jgi:hypothetical protein
MAISTGAMGSVKRGGEEGGDLHLRDYPFFKISGPRFQDSMASQSSRPQENRILRAIAMHVRNIL